MRGWVCNYHNNFNNGDDGRLGFWQCLKRYAIFRKVGHISPKTEHRQELDCFGHNTSCLELYDSFLRYISVVLANLYRTISLFASLSLGKSAFPLIHRVSKKKGSHYCTSGHAYPSKQTRSIISMTFVGRRRFSGRCRAATRGGGARRGRTAGSCACGKT